MRPQLPELTLTLITFLFPLAYSPGPGNMFFAANGARFGFRATVPANAGYHLATWIVTVSIGFGFAATMHNMPQLFAIIKWGGSAYVLYLAWKFIRAGAISSAPDATPAGFINGIALLLLNPKAYLIIALMFSQFLADTDVDETTAVLWISTIFTLNNLIAFIAWTVVGDTIATRFRDEGDARKLNILLGGVLTVVAAWMLLG